MRRYQITVDIQIRECDAAITPNPVEQAEGVFRLVMSEPTAHRIDECEQALLRTNYAALRQALARHLSRLSEEKAQEWARQEGGAVQPHEQPYRVEGEVGRVTFTTHGVEQGGMLRHLTSRWGLPPLQGREWYQTRGFKELALVHGVVEGSYRKTAALINRVRHQAEATPARTLCDTSESEGQQILVQIDRQAEQILQVHQVSPEGVPGEALAWGQAATPLPAPAVAAAVEHGAVPAPWKAEMAANPVSYEDPATQVYVSLDAVGVKEQKAHRDPKPAIAARAYHAPHYVHTTVAQVEQGEDTYVLVHRHSGGLLRWLLAFLLYHGCWDYGLTFLTDGQKTLQAAILRAFAWWKNVQLILDWYHLDKKCRELLSLMRKGRELRNATHQHLRQLLWHGLTGRAIQYLQQVDPETVK